MKDATQLTSGSLPLFVAERLLSRCDVLWESTLVFLGESVSVLSGEPQYHDDQRPLFLLLPRAPVKLQQGTQRIS